jgi:hypothetical protein
MRRDLPRPLYSTTFWQAETILFRFAVKTEGLGNVVKVNAGFVSLMGYHRLDLEGHCTLIKPGTDLDAAQLPRMS